MGGYTVTLKGHRPVTIRAVVPSDTVTDRLITDSDVFRDMRYEIRAGMLIVYTLDNGVLAVPVNSLGKWVAELCDIREAWAGVKT